LMWEMGIREIFRKTVMNDRVFHEHTINIWTSDEVTQHQSGLTMRHSLIAAFTCLCVGLLANVIQCAAFLSELCGQRVEKAKKAALVTGAAMFLFYQLGFLCALIGPRDFIQSTMPEAHRGTPGASIGLFAAAWFGSIVTVGLACSWKDTAAPPAKLGAEAAGGAVPQSNVDGAEAAGVAIP